MIQSCSMATCYGRDGKPDSKFLPCNQTAVLEHKHTSCCKEDEECYTNGLCRHAALGTSTNYYWLEACTDPTFKDPACPPWDPCRHADNLYWKCLDSKAWCCNNGGISSVDERNGHINTTCCNLTDFMFQAPDPVVYATAVQMKLPISTLLTSSENTLDQPSTSISTPTTSPQPTTATPIRTTPTTDAASKQNTTSPSLGSSNSTEIGIGVGVGLGVGVVALCAVLFVMLKRKKRQRNESKGNEIAEMPSPNSRYELHGSQVAAEIMSEKVTYEMRG